MNSECYQRGCGGSMDVEREPGCDKGVLKVGLKSPADGGDNRGFEASIRDQRCR